MRRPAAVITIALALRSDDSPGTGRSRLKRPRSGLGRTQSRPQPPRLHRHKLRHRRRRLPPLPRPLPGSGAEKLIERQVRPARSFGRRHPGFRRERLDRRARTRNRHRGRFAEQPAGRTFPDRNRDRIPDRDLEIRLLGVVFESSAKTLLWLGEQGRNDPVIDRDHIEENPIPGLPRSS